MTELFRNEILNGLELIDINYTDFEHCLEDQANTWATCTKYIETENLNIEIELTEEVKWSAPDDYEFVNLEITDLTVDCENGRVNIDEFKEEELLNSVNYL